MIYGSVCSGIEAASVAWESLGWKAAWFAEIDPFASALLAERYPETPNRGDMNEIKKTGDGDAVDVLVGGTPCQAFSVTGLRKGMDDPRGQLTITFLRIANDYRPRWLVWENVAGILSADGGRAFGSFLGALGELGYGWAYRVLDCSQWGIAQQRRRLFLVANLGSSTAAGAVLFDQSSGRKDGGTASEIRQTCLDADGCIVGWTGDETPKCVGNNVPTLRAMQGGEGVGFMRCTGAWKLTAIEWERLMGFPDNYSAITFRGKPATFSQRRKAIGNSFPVPVVRWIGERIQQVKEIQNAY